MSKDGGQSGLPEKVWWLHNLYPAKVNCWSASWHHFKFILSFAALKMVRVLLFHYFKSQKVFFDSFQPTAITSTKDYLFLATEEMKVLVYSLELPNFPLLCQFPTISRPIKLICNEKAKCVVTVEKKTNRRKSGRTSGVHTHSRAYFNWFKANPDESVRTYVAGHSLRQSHEAERSSKSFLAVEIPTQTNVSGICCCPASGNIAIASQKKVRLFRWNNHQSSDGAINGAASCDIEHFLDIEPCMAVRDVVLNDSYLAMRSNLDVLVLNLVFTSEQESLSSSRKLPNLQNRKATSGWGLEYLTQHPEPIHQEAKDDSCVLWSFDDCSPLSCSTEPLKLQSDEDVMFPAMRKEKVFKDFLPDPKEVLGPVSEVPGHPVTVAFGGLHGIGIAVDGRVWKVKGVIMLYRRFRVEQLSNDGNDSATLHTLQFLPTYTQGISHIKEIQNSPLVQRSASDPTLCGMCCLISSPKEGFMYDIFSTCRLLSYYKYTCDTISVSACSGFLHAITKQGIETYTLRMYAAASDWIRTNAPVDVRLDQPLVEENNLAQQGQKPVNMVTESEQSCQDSESKNVVEFLVGCHTETDVSSSSGAVNIKSPESLEIISGNSVLQYSVSVRNEDVKQQFQSDSPVSLTDGSPSSFPASLSSFEAFSLETPVKEINPSESTSPDQSSLGSKQDDPSDVRLTVDNSGRTIVRFSSGSKPSSPMVHGKGAAIFEDGEDSESNPEVAAFHHTKAFAVVNPLSRSSSSAAKLSEAAYLSAISKLSSDCGWTLPVFDLESLRQRCPQSSLDICLIGMYPFVGSRYVSATEGSVVIFTRASHDALQRSRSFKNRPTKPQQEQGDSAKSDWTVYLLQNMEPTQLYKAVMPLASRCQKHNTQAYHHLVCEQHIFIRTLCLADLAAKEDKKQKKLRKLLCESAANLAELFARIPSVYQDSADYFTMSGLTLRDIVDRASKSGQIVSDGVIHFLDEKLLGSDEPVTVSENTAKKIFKLYSKGKPSRVAEIILMSSLSGFSSDTALAALEDLKKAKTTEGGAYSPSPLDNLVQAVLYLHQCEPDHAHAVLCSIPKKRLVEVLTTHYYLLHEDGLRFTPLAQLLRKHEQAVFVEVLLRLHDKYFLSLDTLLTLLGASKPDPVYSELAVGFLEAVLNDESRVDSFGATVIPLCGIYLERIGKTRRKRLSSSSHQHVPKGEGHFGVRHPWLDKLPPFHGSLSLPVPGCPSSKPASPQGSPQLSRSSLFSNSSRRTACKAPYHVPLSSGDVGAGLEECCCCCCNEDLIKLQALLCSQFVSSELCDFVLSKIEGLKTDMTSVSLLCLPHVNRHIEAVDVILGEFPEVILPYAEYYFNDDIDKWSHLVRILLDLCKEESISDDSESKKEVIVAVLKGTLQQLSTIVTPQEFLVLLPDDGCVGFFLPYLQQCYSRCASQSVTERLVTRTRQLTT